MKQQTQTPDTTKQKLPHVSTYGRYNEIRGILDRQRRGIDCNEDESRAIKVWVKYEKLAIGNGSIELDTEIQELLPLEWGEAQDELGNCDENGKLKEMGLIKIYSPAPPTKQSYVEPEFKLRYSERGGYYFIDEIKGGEGYTVIRFHPDCTEDECMWNFEKLKSQSEIAKALQDIVKEIENANWEDGAKNPYRKFPTDLYLNAKQVLKEAGLTNE